ncbi:MAG: hypothetical protein U0935_08765 [Pirellulales bacterium]
MTANLRQIVPASLLVLTLVGWLVPRPAFGQIGQQVAGVEVDAQGVLRKKMVSDPSGALTRRLADAARAALPADLLRKSDSRKVSLTRLEAQLAEKLAAGQPVTDEMRLPGGTDASAHVFYFPETKDVVLEGPAEGFMPDPAGRVVGLHTGVPVLELEDLIVALRAYPPGGGGAKVISVSIDPTKEGLARMQQFLGQLGAISPNDAQRDRGGIAGEPGIPGSHDSRHRADDPFRAGSGRSRLPDEADRHWAGGSAGEDRQLCLAGQSAGSRAENAMERWYFTPNYECVRVSEDRLAMELVGDGVRLIGENERVTAEGGRVNAQGLAIVRVRRS